MNDYFFACTNFRARRLGDMPRKLFSKFSNKRNRIRTVKVRAPQMSDTEYAGGNTATHQSYYGSD